MVPVWLSQNYPALDSNSNDVLGEFQARVDVGGEGLLQLVLRRSDNDRAIRYGYSIETIYCTVLIVSVRTSEH